MEQVLWPQALCRREASYNFHSDGSSTICNYYVIILLFSYYCLEKVQEWVYSTNLYLDTEKDLTGLGFCPTAFHLSFSLSSVWGNTLSVFCESVTRKRSALCKRGNTAKSVVSQTQIRGECISYCPNVNIFPCYQSHLHILYDARAFECIHMYDVRNSIL